MSARIASYVSSKLFVWLLFFVFGLWIIFPHLFRWHTDSRFVMSNIHLGIDLKGGTYITLGVDVDGAIGHVLESRGRSASRILQRAGVTESTSRTLRGNELVVAFTDDTAASAAYDALTKEGFGEDVRIGREGSNLVCALSKLEEARVRSSIVEQAVNVLRARLKRKDMFLDASVQQHGSRQIVVQLPILDEATHNRIKNLITQRAFLEFKIVKGQGATQQEIEARYDGELPAHLMLVPGRAADGADAETVNRWYVVERFADLDGGHITSARAVRPQDGVRPMVEFTLDSEGARIFHEVTSENSGKQLGIVIDNVMYSAPSIREPIPGGRGVISSDAFTWQSSSDLAHVLSTGSFEAPIKFEQERRVGPSLGQDSIRHGLLACALGLLLVFLFSLVVYKTAGLFATFALVYNLFLILLCLSIFGGTLTLPGIAGLVLTIGMAIDASILIYEKMREELAAGQLLRNAIRTGFSGSMAVILDSNLTTLGIGIVLYYLGGPTIQGFAVTIIVGIISTLISGIFFLKSIFDFIVTKTQVKRIHI